MTRPRCGLGRAPLLRYAAGDTPMWTSWLQAIIRKRPTPERRSSRPGPRQSDARRFEELPDSLTKLDESYHALLRELAKR
jgi:hypothetical protein